MGSIDPLISFLCYLVCLLQAQKGQNLHQFSLKNGKTGNYRFFEKELQFLKSDSVFEYS